MSKERIKDTFYTSNRGLEFMYNGLEFMGMGLKMMTKAVIAPFILEAKLLYSLDRYLWRKGFMDWNPEYGQRKEQK